MKTIRILPLLFLFLLNCEHSPDFLPRQMEDFNQVRLMRGNEAQSFINRLHFNAVSTDSSQIAFYRNKEDREIVLYVTFYSDSVLAREDYHRMTQKISPQNSVFVEGKYIKLREYELYHCFGMGQSHYVFRKERVLIWMTVPTVGGQKLIEQYLDTID